MSQRTSDERPGPLSGLRVLDLTRVLAGPYCTMVLADLGADVVKVERPETGDDSRGFGPFLPTGTSAYFAGLNRGKRSVCLNLKTEDGRTQFERLLARADVLVENFRAGVLDGLGFTPERLRELNPRLVSAAISGFGRDGALAGRPAYDVIIQAASGLMSITGTDPAHPVRVGASISDILSGLYAAIGILAAIRDRDRTGRGAALDVAMLDCTVAALENAISRYDVTGRVPGPLGTRHPSIAPFQAFPTQDTAIVVAAGNDTLWQRLCAVLEVPELVEDPRLRTNADRTENLPYLEERLSERFRRRASTDWLERLQAAGIPSAPIRNVAEVTQDPHLRERGMLHRVEDRAGASFHTAGSPLRVDGRPPEVSHRAPDLGEHTADVLRDWAADTPDEA